MQPGARTVATIQAAEAEASSRGLAKPAAVRLATPPIEPQHGSSETPLERVHEADRTSRTDAGGTSQQTKRNTHRWARWIHVYTSMVALVVVLFFGITGITLNHPS